MLIHLYKSGKNKLFQGSQLRMLSFLLCFPPTPPFLFADTGVAMGILGISELAISKFRFLGYISVVVIILIYGQVMV